MRGDRTQHDEMCEGFSRGAGISAIPNTWVRQLESSETSLNREKNES
jgi:hypothetical protein